MKLRILLAIAVILTAITYCARAAGPATNEITLTWSPPPPANVPVVYEMYSSTVPTTPSVTTWSCIASNIPSTTTNLTLQVDKSLKFFAVLAANATNTSWKSDFSNVAQTLWPNQSGNLSIRLGQ